MRRTSALLRGSKGYGWYGVYKELGQQGFKKNLPPTPFDWSAASTSRPKAVFTVKIDKDIVGDLVFELANDVVPKTVENFARLCKGEGVVFKGYSGTGVHMIRKGEFIMGGDVESKVGQGNHSSYQSRYILDENFIIPHSGRGLLRYCTVCRLTIFDECFLTILIYLSAWSPLVAIQTDLSTTLILVSTLI